MHLVLDHLIKVFICVVFLEMRLYLLITLISLVPLPDLLDWGPSKVLISGLEIILFSSGELVLHGHPFHKILHSVHHQVELFFLRSRHRGLRIPLGTLPISVKILFYLS
jgi:hypothetical protein